MYAQKIKNFVHGLGRGGTDEHRRDIETAFGIVQNFGNKAREIRRDVSLSPSGHKAKIAEMLNSGPLQHLAQLRESNAKQLAAIRAERANLVPKPDKADTFSEMRRQETRTWLRSLPYAERLRAINETKDPVLHEAIAFAPAALSGLTEEQRSYVIDGLVKARHGERLQVLADSEEALQAVQSAYQLAGDDLHREVEPATNRLAVG